jgi:hypothetical protein
MAELVDRYPITCRPVRDLLVRYLEERASAMDYAIKLAENVQQQLNDTFVHTTWPACPLHPTASLWLDGEHDRAVWRCTQAGWTSRHWLADQQHVSQPREPTQGGPHKSAAGGRGGGVPGRRRLHQPGRPGALTVRVLGGGPGRCPAPRPAPLVPIRRTPWRGRHPDRRRPLTVTSAGSPRGARPSTGRGRCRPRRRSRCSHR